MFAEFHYLPANGQIEIRPDRRPAPGANEIRLRVKRALSRQEA